MGSEIRRVPANFKHPVDEEGYYVAGAHLEALYHAGQRKCTHFQLYENVSDGTPTSPIFATLEELVDWLRAEGCPDGTITMLREWGHAPSCRTPMNYWQLSKPWPRRLRRVA